MIRVVATLTLNPEKVEEAIATADELIRLTREEKGCAQYDLVQSIEVPNKLAFFESWDSKEDLDAHLVSAHFEKVFPQLVALCTEEADITVFNKIA